MSYYETVSSLEATRKLIESAKIAVNELVDGNCEIINLYKGYPRINNYMLDDSTDDRLGVYTDDHHLYSIDVENSFGVTYSAKHIEDKLEDLMSFIYEVYEGQISVQEKGFVFKHKKLSTATKNVSVRLENS